MKVGIMQPYFLPYIGYWQLIEAVDTFVILDDVNYINRGWINRNIIKVANTQKWITVPINGASQNKLICDLGIKEDLGWREKMLKTIKHSYRSEINFQPTYELFEEIMVECSGNLSKFLHKSIIAMCESLCIKTKIIASSRIYPKGNLRGASRIIDICKRLEATEYINLTNGSKLYNYDQFKESNITLHIMKEHGTMGGQSNNRPSRKTYSILHTLMYEKVDKQFLLENH
ncbi:WbqC family protein [Prochlorococcus sp. MIT 1303]|uniref:WbqC family protein n=1 Tax=Prochlorococcus sp. MIT 1303 TaxID=1723647 RepID=UPI0007B3378A|nr:WbqC family protein [Prochlorococcus sp. MIT 1303]KZR68958.1 WbqC-like protein family protein [Prochlorococcus sp. MIT 1303]